MHRLAARAWSLSLALGLAALAPAGLRAQSNDEVETAMQFNLSTPGARSLGLGGAFLGLADDATAAYANPAGIAQLAADEASLEGRRWSFTSRFADRGHLPATGVTGLGIDTEDGLHEATLRRTASAPSFASYVHSRGRWAVALYRHQLADFRAALRTHGPFVGPRGNVQRIAPATSRLDLRIANVGASGAWRIGERFAVGLGLSWLSFDLASRTDRYARIAPTGDPEVDRLTGHEFGPADFQPANVANTQLQQGSDHALGAVAGVLFRPAARWSVGAVYRHGPAFRFRATFLDGPAGDVPGQIDPALGGNGTFRVPDVWGAGVAYRPADEWVIAVDADHVAYSQMTADVVNLLRAARGELRFFHTPDVVEWHAGAEYQNLRLRWPLAVRLGTWFDPAHRLRYDGAVDLLQARFARGEDELHLAAGLGLVVRRCQLDLAFDHSPSTDTLSLSAVFRFPG